MNILYPTLAPGVHVFHRSAAEVQIGIDPASAIIADAKLMQQLLPLLVGTNALTTILSEATKLGFDEDSVLNFLDLLAGLTLLVDADTSTTNRARKGTTNQQRINLLRETSGNQKAIESRALTEIEIRGAGRLGTTICLLLAGAGFPNIRVTDSNPTSISDITPWGASRLDIGSRREIVALQIMERVTKGITNHNNYLRFDSDKKLVVLVPDQTLDFPWFDPMSTDELMGEGTPHLIAAPATNESHVSPVIVPGESPCIRCSYYRECDIDPAWPNICKQFYGLPPQDLAPVNLIFRTALAAVSRISDWIDGISQSNSENHTRFTNAQTMKVYNNSSDYEFEESQFHPSCGCAWDRGIFN